MGYPDFPVAEPQFLIARKKLLLVEGIDDKVVFDALCEKMDVTDVQILRYDGKYKLRNFVHDLTSLDGFANVESIAVTMDVDQDRTSARDRIRGALENASLPAPDQPLTFAETSDGAKVTYMLIPHERDHGELEDVCLESVGDEAGLRCVDEFISCVESTDSSVLRLSKSRLQAYLSIQDDPDIRIGEAVAAGYLPYDSVAFEPLRRLISML